MSSTNAGTVCLLIGQTLDSLSTIASSGGPQKGKGLTKISEVIDLVMDLSTFLSSVWWSWLLCLSPVENFNRGSALCLVVSQQGLKWLIKGHSTFLTSASFNICDIARRVNNQVEIAFRKLRSSIFQIECTELDFQYKNQWKRVFTQFRKFKWTFRYSEYPKRPLNCLPYLSFWRLVPRQQS